MLTAQTLINIQIVICMGIITILNLTAKGNRVLFDKYCYNTLVLMLILFAEGLLVSIFCE